MVPPLVSTRRNIIKMEESESGKEPLAGMVTSIILAMISLVIISSFLTQRFLAVKVWSRLPPVQWMVFAIYADSFLFVFATAILQFGFGVDTSASICESAILLCLACYVTTKILIYMFLVEKAFIIRSGSKKLRIHSKLYLFNTIGVLGAYCVVVVLNFVYRITKIENKQCIIGMERYAMIPLIVYDLLVNVYLTVLFVLPLLGLYAFNSSQQTRGNRRLKLVAMRTLIGCICTLTSSVVNLSVLMGLNGEPGWVCLMCCNSDILFSAIVIQWVTSRDSIASNNNNSQTMSQQRHSNHGEDAYDLHKSRQQANGGILEQKNNSSTNRVSINSSSISPRPTPSTKAIIDDIGDIALDITDPTELDDTPTSNNNNPFDGDKLRRSATEDSDEIRMMPLSPRKRGISDSVSPLVSSNQISPTEVRIDVDYGSSLTQANEADGVKLGNSVMIATGGRSDGRRRGRSSSRRYEDNSDP
ncbi:hypothetical protein QBC32DRAFT_19328 [Pseudoneurospora amorphoporcata]|uniref:Uncharacterized protein n=1 Tax=Pseudoneurospora amorphoporcata TaxID=241081 RepID=A0AAN6NR21_9PEZI|nr:hypothetical protein QBC32DRAFT_19328 [Pseudoneurospora amorphoporcata]